MNERIGQLIRLADVHILPDDSEYGHCIIGLEKFAELIVKDCIDLVPWMYEAKIKEHFGVNSDVST